MDLDGLGTDELHPMMVQAVRELAPEHPVRVLWQALDEILTAGGAQCLPMAWEPDGGPQDHWEVSGAGERAPRTAAR
ncbi:hypothetical protein [Streptacidiphilus sp. EB103A]|uniref:hypothetical protein n=1 Tax=Streptacidiphilus sp. EB103A TaxID=3156275 RepID=UPI003515947F